QQTCDRGSVCDDDRANYRFIGFPSVCNDYPNNWIHGPINLLGCYRSFFSRFEHPFYITGLLPFLFVFCASFVPPACCVGTARFCPCFLPFFCLFPCGGERVRESVIGETHQMSP